MMKMKKFLSSPSKGELKDASVLVYAFGILYSEKDEEFLNTEITHKLERLSDSLKEFLTPYKKDTEVNRYISKRLRVITNEVLQTKPTYEPHLTILALVLIYLTLQPNERRFKKLNSNLEKFWKEIKPNLMEIWQTYSDLDNNEDICAETEQFAYDLIERIR